MARNHTNLVYTRSIYIYYNWLTRVRIQRVPRIRAKEWCETEKILARTKWTSTALPQQFFWNCWHFFANRQMNWLLVLTEQAQVCYVSPLCLYARTLICRWVLPIFCLKRWACQSNGPFSAEDSHVNSVPLNVHWFVNVFAWRKLSFTNHLNG